MPRLNVALLWHMHQPCYREPGSRVFRLPWVRLHGLKDYGDMPAMAMRHPGLRLTFNLVPALLEQLEDYARGTATDQHLEITLRRPEDLTEGERIYMLQEFFMANWETMIKPRPRYWELLNRRGLFFHPAKLPELARRFSHQDLLDLQVLFNLAWTDPIHIENDPALSALAAKGRDFTEDDKRVMLERQGSILRSIIPAYRQAFESGTAELCTSPYYHPILPLLCDSDVARECMPQAELPARFCFPHDAAWQLGRAMDYMVFLFGTRPAGLWPSEGSVSRQVVELAEKENLRWLATDEGILERSLGTPLRTNLEPTDPSVMYRPYRLDGLVPYIFFRDRILSDLIGFSYSSWKPEESASDLVARLEKIAGLLGSSAGRYIVPIILDGENAWESFSDDGRGFLDALYRLITQSQKLRTCTFSGFLDGDHDSGQLWRLHPGSWINSDFGIWIGGKEDNQAWDLLLEARQALEERSLELDRGTRDQAFEELAIAEGSDWCWWYGGNFGSEHLEQFDRLFRSHIIQAYRLMGVAPPEATLKPIITGSPPQRLLNEPMGTISPVIDGRSTDYYEWSTAGKLDTSIQGGTMHRSQSLIRTLYYGFDREHLYLRLDPADGISQQEYPKLNVVLEMVKPKLKRIYFPVFEPKAGGEGLQWNFDQIFEIAIPFRELDVKAGQEAYFYVLFMNNSLELEKYPMNEPISLSIPDEKYFLGNWQV